MMRRILAAMGLMLAACSVDPGSDRAGTLADDIRVDSLRFLPFGSRFILRDSPTRIAFLGYHAGYLCSRFVDLGLFDQPIGIPPAYRPVTEVRLPGADRCALDSGNRDTTTSFIFTDSALVRLANPADQVTDSALLVRGTLASDSIRGVPGLDGTFSVGHLTYRDTSSVAGRVLSADSVPACVYLNSADWEKPGKDTVVVRLTWVTLDPAAENGFCAGPAHPDAAPVSPRRGLRMAGRIVFP